MPTRTFTDEQKALARAVLTRILDHPDTWQQESYAVKTDCGAALCFAGHAVVLAYDSEAVWFRWEKSPSLDDQLLAVDVEIGARRRSIADEASRLLGLTICESQELFRGSNTLRDLERFVKMIENDEPLIAETDCYHTGDYRCATWGLATS